MIKNYIIWHPLEAEYMREDMPEGVDFYALLDGDNGPMLGNLYDDRETPGRLIVKVDTPAGLIDAKLLGCKNMTLVAWPEPEPDYTPEQIKELAVGSWVGDLVGQDDGELLIWQRTYKEMADARRAGRVIESVTGPMRTYPAEVWDQCAGHVQDEIERRMAGAEKEVASEPH